MAKGDHLVISYGPYQHHAIDLGDGSIVQYGGGGFSNNRVEVVRLADLPVNRTIHTVQEPALYDADQIVERALSRIGEDRYCLFSNNCEHFVNWCRIGTATSRQVDRALKRTTAAAAKLLVRHRGRNAVRQAAKWSTRVTRTATPWLVVADIAQLGTEIVASHRGCSSKHSENAGRMVGVGASVGIGALAGGPIGAAVGIGIWAVGEAAGKIVTG